MMSEDVTRAELAKILAKKPNWMIRWGTTVLCLILAILGLMFVIFCKN